MTIMDTPAAESQHPRVVVPAPSPRTDGGQDRLNVLEAIRAGQAVESVVHPEVNRAPHVLETSDFSLWYGEAKTLHEVTMGVPRGKVTALIGPSGCGKSTLLRSINRLNDLIDGVRIDGDVSLNGEPVYSPSVDVIELRKRLGMVFQRPNPFPMSIFENVVYPLRIDGENRRPVLPPRGRCTAAAAAPPRAPGPSPRAGP